MLLRLSLVFSGFLSLFLSVTLILALSLSLSLSPFPFHATFHTHLSFSFLLSSSTESTHYHSLSHLHTQSRIFSHSLAPSTQPHTSFSLFHSLSLVLSFAQVKAVHVAKNTNGESQVPSMRIFTEKGRKQISSVYKKSIFFFLVFFSLLFSKHASSDTGRKSSVVYPVPLFTREGYRPPV